MNYNEILNEKINKAENERLDAKKAMERAEEKLERAEEKLERAEEAFTEDWREKNPNGSKAELLKYLDSKLAKYSAAVESCKEIYKELSVTHKELVKKIPDVNSATRLNDFLANTLGNIEKALELNDPILKLQNMLNAGKNFKAMQQISNILKLRLEMIFLFLLRVE